MILATLAPWDRSLQHFVQMEGAGCVCWRGFLGVRCPPCPGHCQNTSATLVFPDSKRPRVPNSGKEAVFCSPAVRTLHREFFPSLQPPWLRALNPKLFPALSPPQYTVSQTGHTASSRFCLHSLSSLRLAFLFGSLLRICVVPVFSTNIPCPLVKLFSPFQSVTAREMSKKACMD